MSTSDDDARLSRIKTILMDPEERLEPHDLAWLFRLADEALRERKRTSNHLEGSA